MLCTCADRDLDQFASSTWLTDSRNGSHLDVTITRVYPEPSQHHTKILPYVPTIRCRSSPPECLWLRISRVLLNSSPIHLKPWQVPWGSPSCFSFTSHALEFCAHVLTSFSPAFSTCTFPSLKLPPFFFFHVALSHPCLIIPPLGRDNSLVIVCSDVFALSAILAYSQKKSTNIFGSASSLHVLSWKCGLLPIHFHIKDPFASFPLSFFL